MGYGIEHTAPLPVVGITPRTTWAEQLIDALAEIRETLDAKVTPAGIDVNANISMRSGASFYALTDLSYASLYTQPALLSAGTYPGVVYKSSTGNLYFNDDSGNQIQLTSGGSVAAAAGNITGTGYGSSGVEVAWVSADSAYEFRSGAGADDFADGKFDDVYLNDGSGNYLRIAAPTMGADYTLTLPAAVPLTGDTVLAMSITGVVTVTDGPTLATLQTSGDVVVGGELTVSNDATFSTDVDIGDALTVVGLIGADGGILCGGDENIELQGTGYIKHGTRTLVIPGTAFVPADPSVTSYSYSSHVQRTASTDLTFSAPLVLPVGAIVTNVRWLAHNGSSTNDREFSTYRSDITSTTQTAIETVVDANSAADVDVSNTTDFDILASRRYHLKWRSRTSGDYVLNCVISYYMP